MDTIEEIGFGGLKLLQSEDGFRFGIDAVLLADFACRYGAGSKNITDLGTGNGVIPLIMSHKSKDCYLTGIDVQAKAIELAEKNCEMNRLTERMSFMQCDVSELAQNAPQLKGTADVVVSNPPYVARGAGLINGANSRFISRQETTAGLEDFIAAAAFLLKDKGHFCMIHRPSRLVDIFSFCRGYSLEPKNIQFILPKKDAGPNLVLIHSVKGGGRELAFCEELYVHEEDGEYSPEILKIYEKTR